MDECKDIHRFRDKGFSLRAIARRLNRSASALAREVGRDTIGRCSDAAPTDRAAPRRRYLRSVKLNPDSPLMNRVRGLMAMGSSSEQAAGRLRCINSHQPTLHVSHETIYALPRAELRSERINQVRFAHKSRMPRSRGQSRRGELPNMNSIHLGRIEVPAHLIPGHSKGGLVSGAGNRGAVGTLVEHRSGCLLMTRLRDYSADAVVEVFTRKFRDVPPCVRKTLTYDQGKATARQELLVKRLKMNVYFADPHSLRQRPTNENTNGLLREYLPKGLNLAPISRGHLNRIARQLNDRPPKCLYFEKPAAVFTREIHNLESGVALQI